MTDYANRERERRAQGPLRYGTVVAVSTAEGLDVAVGGAVITGLQFLDSYTAPGEGDRVAMSYHPGQYLVLGKVGIAGNNLGPNLLPNPGFELGISDNPWPSGWGSFFAEVTRVENEALAHSSGAVVKFDLTGVAAGSGRNIVTTNAMAVESGETYRLGAWWKAPISDPFTAGYIQIVTAATQDSAQFGAAGSTYAGVAFASLTDEWSEITGTITIPAGHNYARVFLTAQRSTGFTVTEAYVDDVSFREQI